MLIVLKVETELPLIMHLIRSFEWFEQVSDLIRGEQRTAQDSHDLHDGTANLHVMFDDTNEAICDDGNMYLNAYGILGFSPEGLDSKMLLDPLEEQFDLPSVFIKECNVLGFKIEIISVVGEGSLELWRVVNNAAYGCRIARFIPLASETYCLVTKDVIFPFLEVKTALNLIGGMKLLAYNEECSGAIDFIEPCKVKVSSVKHIACKRLVCKPVHGVDIMHLCVRDSVEYGDFRDDVNLGVDSYSRLGRPELCPSENRKAKVDCRGVNRIESSVQLKLSGKSFRLGNSHHVECKLFKDPIVSDRVRLGKHLSVDSTSSKAEKERLVSMGYCNICKFPETSTAEQLAEHENQQMAPMGKRPTSRTVVVLNRQTFEIPLREKLGDLRENIVTRMHTCFYFDSDAKVCISKVRQTFGRLCDCA